MLGVRALDNCLDGHGMLSTRGEDGRASVRQLTEEDLQGICVQLQVLGLLFHHIHVLCVLAVEAVDTGVGQHLEGTPSGQCI